jgi:hypothetical protein
LPAQPQCSSVVGNFKRAPEMKLILIALTCILSIIASQQKSKLDMVSQKWRQIGLKSFGRDYKSIDKSISETITINKDGTFEQDVYGTIHFKGQ